MKYIKKIAMLLLFLSLTACSESKSKTEVNIKPYNIELEKGLDMNNSIWGSKPSYKLKIKGTHTKVLVYLNGKEVYRHFSLASCYIEYPINAYITSGKNDIRLIVFTDDINNLKMHKWAKATVNLVVRSSETGKEYVVSTLDYDNKEEDKLAHSSEAKEYKFAEISSNTPEFVHVSIIENKHYTNFQGDKVEGRGLTHTVNLRTPYPRWKFLDSENIINISYDEMTDKEYEKFKESKEIQELYALMGEIHSAIEKGDIESIIDMFDERNIEMDKAYYKSEGETKKGFYKELIETSHDDSWKIIAYNPKKEDYFIEENKKIAYINVIRFKSTDGIYKKYMMRFRRENGKWILTR